MMAGVIEGLAYHTAPIGVFGDLTQRQREEREWIDSLSVDDVLALLEWVRHPSPLAGAYPIRECDVLQARYEAATYAGRAGRRLRDKRIRDALEAMLADSETRIEAFAGLAALRDPATVPVVARLAIDAEPQIASGVVDTLSAIAGPEAIAALEAMLQRWGDQPKLRRSILSALDEARNPEED